MENHRLAYVENHRICLHHAPEPKPCSAILHGCTLLFNVSHDNHVEYHYRALALGYGEGKFCDFPHEQVRGFPRLQDYSELDSPRSS